MASARNVLLVTLDDMIDVVRYRHAFGVDIQTPAIDSLAARGVTFANAFTPVPICNPSRVATLTGRRPFSTDVYHDNDPRIDDVVPVGDTVLGAAHDVGWFTATQGKVFHGTFNGAVQRYLSEGLDIAKWVGGYRATGGLSARMGDPPVPTAELQDTKTAAWASQFLADPPDKAPLFLALGMSKPDLGWDVPKEHYDLYDRAKIDVPEIVGLKFKDLPGYYRIFIGFDPGAQDRIVTAGLWKDHIQAIWRPSAMPTPAWATCSTR